MVNCPLCDAAMDVDEEELDEGDALVCEECGASVTVSSVVPLELAVDADEDLEDDEEFDDEFDDDEDDEEEEDEEEE
jgi:alpha-aminoadipate/glutamate carrier protein LysW